MQILFFFISYLLESDFLCLTGLAPLYYRTSSNERKKHTNHEYMMIRFIVIQAISTVCGRKGSLTFEIPYRQCVKLS